jgi:hypothetical protein
VADVHETHATARAMLREATNVKMVLVPVSPFFPFQDNAVHNPASRRANYGIIAMQSIEVVNGDLDGWFAARHQGLRAWARVPGLIRCLIFPFSDCTLVPDMQRGGVFPPNFPDIKAKFFLDFVEPDFPDTTSAAHQIKALHTMAEDLSARGVTLVLYPSPLSKELLDALDRGYEERGWTGKEGPVPDIEMARELIMSAMPSELCLHWVGGLWSDEDARTSRYFRPNDVDHLSGEGARLFTSRLVEQLANLEGCVKFPK